MNRPRVLLADDHRMFAECLGGLLEPEFDLVGVVEDGRLLQEAAQRLDPDVIVTEITMPGINGLEAVERLRQSGCRAKIVILTMQKDVGYARRALRAGAAGFVLKHSASGEVRTAIHAALAGRRFVTPVIEKQLAVSLETTLDESRQAARGDRAAPAVIIVEDDEGSRRSICGILRALGQPLRCYASGEAFLRDYRPPERGCLVLDLFLPGLDGLSIVERVRQTSPALPIILVSGLADVQCCLRAFRLGVFDLVEKPLDECLLRQRVEKALELDDQETEPRAGLEVLEARARLSEREKVVFDQLLAGKSLKQIAASCEFSIQSAWKHQQKIFAKFRVHSEVELVRLILSGKALAEKAYDR